MQTEFRRQIDAEMSCPQQMPQHRYEPAIPSIEPPELGDRTITTPESVVKHRLRRSYPFWRSTETVQPQQIETLHSFKTGENPILPPDSPASIASHIRGLKKLCVLPTLWARVPHGHLTPIVARQQVRNMRPAPITAWPRQFRWLRHQDSCIRVSVEHTDEIVLQPRFHPKMRTHHMRVRAGRNVIRQC